MLTYEEFKKVVVNEILGRLDVPFEAKVVIAPAVKVNETLEGLTILPVNETRKVSVSPTVYLEPAYKHYRRTDNVEQELNNLAKKILDAFKNVEKYPLENSYEKLSLKNNKDKIFLQLIKKDGNEELLSKVPHRDYLDMAIIYRVAIDTNEKSMSSFIIKNEMSEVQGFTERMLYELAYDNTKRLFPFEIHNLGEKMKELCIKDGMPREIAEMMYEESPLWVISNRQMISGANGMIYKENLRTLADRLNDDLYILPSSIHEVLCVKVSEFPNVRDLKDMVSQVNAEGVADNEILSDNVYIYKRKNESIEITE